MTRDELLAAANHVAPVADDDWDSWYVRDNAKKLARHVQQLYDPTPVDGEWFVAIGGRRTAGRTWRIEHLEFWLSSDGPTLWNGSGWRDNPTRGDVRRLCDALGIELREGA